MPRGCLLKWNTSRSNEEAQRLQLETLKGEVLGLKRSHEELQKSHQAVAKQCLESDGIEDEDDSCTRGRVVLTVRFVVNYLQLLSQDINGSIDLDQTLRRVLEDIFCRGGERVKDVALTHFLPL